MFGSQQSQNQFRSALGLIELIYFSTVRHVRRSHRNAVIGLATNVMQTVIFVAVFYVMFSVLGIRGSAIRGDFILYLLSGIYLLMVHTKAMGAVVKAEGPTSPMMHHAPLNTTVTMLASAIASLYLQILSLGVILGVYHLAWTPVTIEEPLGAIGMVLLAWLSGVGVGLCFAALKPWAPDAATLLSSATSYRSARAPSVALPTIPLSSTQSFRHLLCSPARVTSRPAGPSVSL